MARTCHELMSRCMHGLTDAERSLIPWAEPTDSPGAVQPASAAAFQFLAPASAVWDDYVPSARRRQASRLSYIRVSAQ